MINDYIDFYCQKKTNNFVVFILRKQYVLNIKILFCN